MRQNPEKDPLKEIPLTQGKVALVDDEDYERLSAFNWFACFQRGRWYAMRRRGTFRGRQKNEYLHHRVLAKRVGLDVDHIDRNGLDCRRSNLRYAPRWGNNANQRKQSGTSSKFKGVTWDAGCKKWRAQIKFGGRRRYLGVFVVETLAARAYDAEAKALFGEFARLNFI